MGYTHYYGISERVKVGEQHRSGFRASLPHIRDIVAHHANILTYECDELTMGPEVSEKCIRFNGRNDDGYETFQFSPDNERTFCKTAHKPYDLPVCECLLILNVYVPDFHLRSDGFYGLLHEQLKHTKMGGAWEEAMQNVAARFGIHHEVVVLHERDPYCDLGLVRVHPELSEDKA